MLAQPRAKLLRVTTNEEVRMATRNARATWRGNLKEGEGTMALGSGVWEGPFSFKTRFEDGKGTNPAELIGAPEDGPGRTPEALIGAAEDGCFTMQLSATLAEAGHVPDLVQTDAKVHIRNID